MGLLLPILATTTGPSDSGRAPAAPARARQNGGLIDSHGRTIRDLRLSITDRCNFRCVYCMDQDTRFLDAAERLTPAELVRVARVGVGLGIQKVRITGGEPTVHPELDRIIGDLSELGLRDLALTTNGSLASEARLRGWRRSGLRRVTFSLDSLRPERFAALTRSRTSPDQVLAGVAAALRAGLDPVKINAVVVRGFNDDELPALAALARRFGVEVRFIEFMPLDAARAWDRSRVVGADEIIAALSAEHRLVPVGRQNASATALRFAFADGAPGSIGVIAPVTRPFCGACARLRITADGKVRPCLFSREEWDLRPLLRAGADDNAVATFLVDATWTKQAGHGISSPTFAPPVRTMSAIGG